MRIAAAPDKYLTRPGAARHGAGRDRRGSRYGMSNWVKAADAADFGDGDVRVTEIAGTEVAIYQVDGTFFATDNICTHAYARLSDGFLDDCSIECPLHAGRFDIRTGKALSGPVTEDLRSYPVKIEGGDVLIDLG
jgi:naphthalene 1,2-dioxygenase system ferredoxin subunit